MEKTHKKTNLYVIDEEVWEFAKLKSKLKGFRSVSDYVFELLGKDLEEEIETLQSFRRFLKRVDPQ